MKMNEEYTSLNCFAAHWLQGQVHEIRRRLNKKTNNRGKLVLHFRLVSGLAPHWTMETKITSTSNIQMIITYLTFLRLVDSDTLKDSGNLMMTLRFYTSWRWVLRGLVLQQS